MCVCVRACVCVRVCVCVSGFYVCMYMFVLVCLFACHVAKRNLVLLEPGLVLVLATD